MYLPNTDQVRFFIGLESRFLQIRDFRQKRDNMFQASEWESICSEYQSQGVCSVMKSDKLASKPLSFASSFIPYQGVVDLAMTWWRQYNWHAHSLCSGPGNMDRFWAREWANIRDEPFETSRRLDNPKWSRGTPGTRKKMCSEITFFQTGFLPSGRQFDWMKCVETGWSFCKVDWQFIFIFLLLLYS